MSVVLNEIAAAMLKSSQELGRFAGRGISQRTIETLIEAGYIFPEHVLFADLPGLRAVKGIGKKALAEIDAYRKRILPEHGGPG